MSVSEEMLKSIKARSSCKFNSDLPGLGSGRFQGLEIRGSTDLKVHKIEIFFGFDFEICIISLLVM